MTRLEKGRARLQQTFAALTPEQWQRTVYEQPSIWTVRDVLAHLVSAQGALRRLARNVAAGGTGAPPGMDYDAFNAAEQVRLRGIQPEALLRHFDEAHQTAADWVGTLDDGQLDRVGRHPALGEVTVETMINAIYGHQLLHLRDLPAEL